MTVSSALLALELRDRGCQVQDEGGKFVNPGLKLDVLVPPSRILTVRNRFALMLARLASRRLDFFANGHVESKVSRLLDGEIHCHSNRYIFRQGCDLVTNSVT